MTVGARSSSVEEAVPETLRGKEVLGQAVEAGAVVPEDLSQAVSGEIEGEEHLHGLGVAAVGVGIVGGEDDVVVAKIVDGILAGRFVGLDRGEALAFEVLRRA